MKKASVALIAFVSLLCFSIAMSSCSKKGFLEQTTTSSLDEATVFSDSAYAMNFLNNIYINVGFSFSPTRFDNNGGLDAASTESDVPKSGTSATSLAFATGSISASIVSSDAWSNSYAQIRAVNQYFKHLPVIPFDESLKRRTKAEARFLRAWYYSILLRHYGGIPIIGDTIYTDSDFISAKRNTYEECVDYIVSECEAAALDLPLRQQGVEYGRVGKGSCYALKARVLLYAASPLFNGNNDYNANAGEKVRPLIGYLNADKERWKKALDAAYYLISQGQGVFKLHDQTSYVSGQFTPSFQDLFCQRVNYEYLFAKMNKHNARKDFEQCWLPPTRGGNGNGGYPYQELVDAFPMKNGKAITDPTSGYNPGRPYDNRDPRLGFTIIRDSSLIVMYYDGLVPNMGIPVEIYVLSGQEAGQDAFGKRTTTGYYTNKMLKPDISGNCVHGDNLCWPLMRYAEVLLNYAEALNEYSGPVTAVYDALKAIRQRAGIEPGADNLYGLDGSMDQAKMREIIHNERRIELAFEEHWFWDTRRWLTASKTENAMMHGMRITREPKTGGKINKITAIDIVNVRKHNFRDAMYLWPIPQSEIGKSVELIQNPYWTTVQ